MTPMTQELPNPKEKDYWEEVESKLSAHGIRLPDSIDTFWMLSLILKLAGDLDSKISEKDSEKAGRSKKE